MLFLFAEGSSWGLDFTLLGYSSFMYFHSFWAIVTWGQHNTSVVKVQLSKLECWEWQVHIENPNSSIMHMSSVSCNNLSWCCPALLLKTILSFFSQKMIHTFWKPYSVYLIDSFFLSLNEPSPSIHYTYFILAVEMLYQTNNHVKDSSLS